jgi:hypothetical protein
MMLFISEFLKTLLLSVIYAATGYLILFYKGPSKKSPVNFRVAFLSFFMGLVFVVSLYSIWFTHGKTVQVIFLPLLILLAVVIRKKDHAFIKNEYSPYFLLSAILLFIIIFFGYSYLGSSNEYLSGDYILYSKISYYMPKTGFENDYHIFNTLDGDYRAATPYHYFDLWLNSVNCSIMPGVSRYDTFLLVTPTILLVVIFLAFLAIYETYRKPDAFGLLLALAILFFGGIFLPFYHKIPILHSFEYCFSPFTGFHIVKFAPTVLFMVAAYVVLTNLNLLAALLTLSMLAVVSAVNIPGISFAFVFTFVFFKLFHKRLQLDFPLRHLVIALVPVVSVALFYVFFGNHLIVRGGASGPEIMQQLHQFIKPVFLKHFMNITGSSAINILVIYLLFIPVIFLSLYKKQPLQTDNIFYFLISLGFCIGGVIAWGFLSTKTNAIQTFYFTLKSLPVLIFISLIVIDYRPLKYTVLCIICIFTALNIYKCVAYNNSNHSKEQFAAEYAFAVKHMDTLSLTASIKDSSDYIDDFSYYSTCFGLGRYLSLYNNAFFPISISDYNLPFVKDPDERALYMEGYRLGVFYRFVEKQKKSGSFVSIEESQIDFIKKYQIRNILLSPKASLPPLLLQLADSNIAIVPNDGEGIVRLRY